MRIAHITATFPPYYAGTGLVCYYQARELARLGHSVTVFTAADPSGEAPSPEGVTVRRLPALFRMGNAPFLPGLLALRDFDVLHLHYPFIFGAEMVRLVSVARRIPYVLTHHNDLIGDGVRRYLFDFYTAVCAPPVFRGARKYLVVSRDHAASCRLASFFRRRPADVVEVPNGVDTEHFRPDVDGTEVRRRYGIPESLRLVLFVGSLDRAHPFKGAGYLLRAFARMGDQGVGLMLVGDGDLKPSLVALAETLGIARRVWFVGTVPHWDLPPYYAASDLVVLPSFLESFGMVLIEAMACGRPVLAHAIPGARSVVRDGEDGLLARPGDMDDLVEKMRALLEDPSRRAQMGRQGRARVEAEYAWPRIIPRLVQAYQEALESDTDRHRWTRISSLTRHLCRAFSRTCSIRRPLISVRRWPAPGAVPCVSLPATASTGRNWPGGWNSARTGRGMGAVPSWSGPTPARRPARRSRTRWGRSSQGAPWWSWPGGGPGEGEPSARSTPGARSRRRGVR